MTPGQLATTHAVAAVVAEVAVAVADRDRPAVVTGRRIDLEVGKLTLSVGWAAISIDLPLLHKLLRDAFKASSAPFSGEPLASLQVMGFLETRSLDFENIIILSVNEDLIPAGSSSASFIPFGVRKAFRLPTFIDQNSIYSYHFYRLLQRATSISLIYSTQLSVTGGGEKSRFLLQLENAFAGKDQPILNGQDGMVGA